MRPWLVIVLLSVVLFPAGSILQAASVEHPIRRQVVRVRVDNKPITPATVRFIQRALQQARELDAICMVIELDTPGGLLDSTHTIVRDILGSPIPVIVYVSPAGARAASAGLFITLSAHVSAMAQGTHIGAASPVPISGLPVGPTPDTKDRGQDPEAEEQRDSPGAKGGSTMAEKMVHDTEAWGRSLAELRGHNAEWAALAVTESRSITGSEAVAQRVVDLKADSWDELLQQLDGREVAMGDHTVRLQTAGAEIVTVDMWWGENLLGVLANPNVALLLLVFGFYGILFELYSPGWGVIGTLGVLCLILGFFGLSVLPVNYAGLALLLLALGLFVAEAYVTSFGVLTLGGAVCLLLGSLMLVDSPGGFMRVSLHVAAPVAIATSLITLFLVGSVVRVHRRAAQTGGESLVGQFAVARESFSADMGEFHGTVFVHGELWRAISKAPVADGQLVQVQGSNGLTLKLEN